MRTYTVHARLDALDDEPATRRFVKEGFAWPALFFPLLWLLYHRMWLVVLAWLAVGVALSAVGNLVAGAGDTVATVSILFAVWFAFEANGLRRWSLMRKGWEMIDVANGRGRWEAELSHFRRAEFVPAPYQTGSAARPAMPGVRRRGETVVGGLFPEAGR